MTERPYTYLYIVDIPGHTRLVVPNYINMSDYALYDKQLDYYYKLVLNSVYVYRPNERYS